MITARLLGFARDLDGWDADSFELGRDEIKRPEQSGERNDHAERTIHQHDPCTRGGAGRRRVRERRTERR